MHWIVRGYDRATGHPKMINVGGDSQQEAVRAAGDDGLVVESIEQVLTIPGRTVGGWSLFREGTGRTRYLFFLAWACRLGGLISLGFVVWIFFETSRHGTGWTELIFAFISVLYAIVVAAIGEMLMELVIRRSGASPAPETHSR